MKPFPRHLEIELTNACQLRCAMCPRKGMKREVGYMDWPTLKKIVDEAKGRTKYCYLHQFGDPLLHPEVMAMTSYVSLHGIRTSLSTNALALKERDYEAFTMMGLDEIIFPVETLDPEQYAKLRVGGDFEKAIRNIDRFIEQRKKDNGGTMNIQVHVIGMKKDIADGEKVKQKYGPMLQGVGEIIEKPFSTWAGNIEDMTPNGAEKINPTCKMLWLAMAIYWNGDAVVCCRDFDGATKVGNIKEQTIEEIWNGEKYNELREVFQARDWKKIPFCENC